MKTSISDAVKSVAVLCVLAAVAWGWQQVGKADTDAVDALLAIQQPDWPGNRYAFRVTNVVDGDTIDGDITLGWGVTLANQRVRCSDFDAWEKSKRRSSVTVTDAEVVRGKAATEFLTAFVKGKSFMLSPDTAGQDRDNYGRILGRVLLRDGGDVKPLADIMRLNGHVREETNARLKPTPDSLNP
jgi:endonuclease YncB( thermonuclease family)